MKKFLSEIFPDWINDKGKHAILGTLIFLGVWVFFDALIALIVTYIVAVSVEIYDKVSGYGESDYKDAIWTVVVPTIIYLIWQI